MARADFHCPSCHRPGLLVGHDAVHGKKLACGKAGCQVEFFYSNGKVTVKGQASSQTAQPPEPAPVPTPPPQPPVPLKVNVTSKGCPICGNQPYVITHQSGLVTVTCDQLDHFIRTCGPNADNAIAIWNTRHG